MTNDQTATLPDRAVSHQRHQHARRGGRGREHEGYCKSAQIRPAPAPVRGLQRRRHAVMHSLPPVERNTHARPPNLANTEQTMGTTRWKALGLAARLVATPP